MELRRSLLEIARENIIDRLTHCGITFGFEEKTIDLVFGTLIYVTIVIFVIIIVGREFRLNLIALSASLGIGAIAVAFAARQAIKGLIGTLELYLDRPYVPGEYIKVTFNPYGEDVYGRVDSVGLRSTKIRTSSPKYFGDCSEFHDGRYEN